MSQASRASEIDVGTLVAKTYRVVRPLGRGGMGAVWEAHHERLPGKRVAIKVLHADVSGDDEALARFRREAEIASKIGHPNIVEVHDFNCLPSGAPYLVLEFLEGESLDERLRRGPLSFDEVHAIVRPIGSALRAAHLEGVVHRDLKPQNVFLAREGDDAEVVKVLDFGVSKIRGSQTVKTQATSMLGTPQYMAPEQATANNAAVDARTDVFALGAMVYELLSGSPAFVGQTIPEVVFKVVYEEPAPLADKVPSLPPRVTEAVHRALEKKQDRRFESVESFVEMLTGSPLTSGRRRAPGAPGGDTPAARAGSEALAATAASGDQPGALAATAASGDQAGALDETTASARSIPLSEPTAGARGDRASLGAAATESAGSHRELAAAEAREAGAGRSPLKAVILAFVAAGLGAAVAVALVARPWADGGDVEATAPEEPAPAQVVSLAPADGGAERAQASEDETAAEASAGAEKAAEASAGDRAPATVETPSESPDRGGDRSADGDRAPAPRGSEPGGEVSLPPEVEAEVEADLEAAAAALGDGDYDEAIRLVDRAERSAATARGFSIKARAYCGRRDHGNARANWRNLSPRGQERVARFCEPYDIDL